jgi:FAD/FMN-containing dehydrogenase
MSLIHTPPPGDTSEDDLGEYRRLLGPERVLTGGRARGYLRDFSWYSPVLENALADTTIAAVLRPRSVSELAEVVSIAVRGGTPITLRGAGTGNYGQSLPLRHGLVIDVRAIAGVLEVTRGRIAVLPGTVLQAAEEAAREFGQELAVMPTTYRIATAAGFICGGSGGIGAAANGDLWDGNVLAVEMLTAEAEPRLIRLEGDDVRAVLHTYGTIGIVTRVEFRLVPIREYEPVIATFGEFAAAAALGHDLVGSPLHVRLASVQQAPIGSMFTPLKGAYPADAHLALLWVDAGDAGAVRERVRAHGGETLPGWPSTTHISHFAFSHTILWSRKADPAASWLQCEYASGRGDFLGQVDALRDRFGGVFLQHIEFTSSAGRVRPMGIPPLVNLADHERSLDEVIGFCRSIGITVLNPHSYVVEEGGFVGDTSRVVELKASCDPHNLLNPGKLGDSFFTSRGLTPPSERARAQQRNTATPPNRMK